jgi:uncharacterized protein (TIGR02145 family)
MKKTTLILGIIVLAALSCCKKDEEPDTTVTDIEGNVYNTVVIGEQTWMVENFKALKLNDGTPLATETDSAAWYNLKTAAYCWYNNDASYAETDRGALYNSYAAQSGNLCPTGWHVATDDDFVELEVFMGMDEATALLEGFNGTDEAKRLKATTGWPDFPGTDEYGLKIVQAGARMNLFEGYPDFQGSKFILTNIWSNSGVTLIVRQFDDGGNDRARFANAGWVRTGNSVRCVKDQ